MSRLVAGCLCLCLAAISGCAGSGANLPYPAFIQADELPDVFLAALPGARAKQFAGNPQSRRTSNRVVLPASWSGTSGASPSKSLEIYVLRGRLKVGDLVMEPGGYAFFPPGFSGANLGTDSGVEFLYFLDDANPANVIQTPIIYSSDLAEWRMPDGEALDSGLSVKDLRHDPGSGARTWLLRVSPAARLGWQRRARVLEGYLLSGNYRASECHGGKLVTGMYLPGGYFQRPADVVHGGPQERALEPSVWLLRTRGHAPPIPVAACAGTGSPGAAGSPPVT